MVTALLSFVPWLAPWLARLAGLRASAGRFRNTQAGAAALVLGLACCLALAVAVAWWSVRDGVASARDQVWQTKLALARLSAARQRELLTMRSEAAAAAEREAAVYEQERLREHVSDLEQTISHLKDGDPVIFPRDLVRSLRR